MKQKQFLNSLGLSSPHLSQHLLRLLLLLVTAIGGVGSSWAEEVITFNYYQETPTGYTQSISSSTGTYTLQDRVQVVVTNAESITSSRSAFKFSSSVGSIKIIPSTNVTITKVKLLNSGSQTTIESTGITLEGNPVNLIEGYTTPFTSEKTFNTAVNSNRYFTDIEITYKYEGLPDVGTIKSGTAPNITWNFASITADQANLMQNEALGSWTAESGYIGNPIVSSASYWAPSWCEGIELGLNNSANDHTKARIYTSSSNIGFYLGGGAASMKVTIPAGANTLTVTSGTTIKSGNAGITFSNNGDGTYTAKVTEGDVIEIRRDGNTGGSITLVETSYVEPTPYTVTFDASTNGNCTTGSLTQSAVGASITLPGATPKPGYTFHGWDTNGDGTADAHTGDAFTPEQDITLTAVYTNNNVVGDANEGWWSAFSNFVTLPKDNSIHLTFNNVSYGEEYWRNWLMIVTSNNKGHNGDGEQTTADNELYMLRPDYFASKGTHECQFYKDDNGQYRTAYLTTDEERAAFKAAISNSTVDVQVSFDGNNVYTIAKINGTNGTKYILVDKSTNSFNGPLDNVYVSFMADKSTMTFTAQNDATPSVKVNVSANNPEYTTGYVAKIASGIRLDNNRPILAGTNVEFQATPKAGYTLVNWTDEASNVISTEEGFSKVITADANYTANFAANYSYTVNAVDGSGNVLKEIKAASVVAGSNVTVHYPKYILNAGTLYEIAKNSSHPDYGITFTPDADNYVKNITYTASSIENVVYYTEAEDLKSYTTCATGNGSAVGSNGKVARGTNNNVTTLSPGKYKIWAKGVSNADRTATFTVGSTDVFSFAFKGNYNEQTSDEFAVNTESVLKVSISGSDSDGLDCFYVVRTGDAVTYNVTQAASTGGSIKSSVNLTQPVPAGTNITFTATANEWYQVDNWYDEATVPATLLAGAVNTCDVTVNADMNVKVNFIRYYNVQVETAGGGTVALKNEAKTEDVAANAKIKRGTKVTAIATPASGYRFVRWEANGATVQDATEEYQQKVENLVDANATLITLNAVFEEDAVTVAVPTADRASGSNIYLGDKITLSAEEGATIHYIWASVSGLYTTVADMQAESDRLKSSTTNTIQTSTNTVGSRYLYVYAQKGNWTSDVVCFNYTAQILAGEATVLEVRGTKHSGDAPYYFTNSINTGSVKFDQTQEYSDGTQISPLSADQNTTAYYAKSATITIKLNSTSASKIIVGAKGGGNTRKFSSIKVNGTEPTSYTADKDYNFSNDGVKRFEISGLNIAQGSEVTLTFGSDMRFYYFEVYSTSQINAPKIKDNGDKSATITSNTDGATIYYNTYTEKPASIPSVDDLTLTLKDGKTEEKVESTSYVYAVAKKDGKYSDITEGIINVATTPSLSCRPVAVTLSHDDTSLPQTQQITTEASMNKEKVTSNYTYSYTSDKETVATVSNSGLITAVSAGSAKITITAKSGDDVVATDEVIVVVTDKDMITPEFTWNGTQFDVVVNNKFNDKTPKAYKEVTLNTEQRFVDITSGYDITYFSSNDNASVDKNGVVTGLKIGQATITAVFIAKDDYAGSYNPGIATIIASVKEGGAAPLNVEVSNNPPVIDLSTSALTYQSKTPTLVAAQYTPLSNSEWFATYESDNWNVATVDANGLVTAHNVGEAHIVVAYMPVQTGPYADDFNAFVHTYTIKVEDPTRFVVTSGYGYDESTKHSTIFPLSTVTDKNKYVTMTFGGWRGVNGTDDVTYNSDKKRDEGTEYNGGRDYWGGSSDAGKTDAAGANPDYPYAITSKSGGNPSNEAIKGYDPDGANQFSVPCRGAYIMFEPAVDGTITANIIQNGVLDAKNFENDPATGRIVYIVDEFGKVVTPTVYGMASDVRNWKIGAKSTTLKEDKKTPLYGPLTAEKYLAALKAFNLIAQDATEEFLEKSYEGVHAPGNVEVVIPWKQGYVVLAKGPAFYTFNVKAGKKYYIFGNGTKNGFYGFQFRKDNSFSATDITISTESGVSKVNDGADLTMDAAISKYNGKPVVIKEYDRNFTAGIWTPLVLPYSMNDIQVKSIFGDDVEILYVDDVKGSTIKMSHHFYKTIVAGKSCLIKPSKAVMSLATTGITKDGVAYPYVTFSNASITGYSDYTTGKDGAGYTWSPSYDPQDVAAGDYYISTKDGNFTRLAAGKTAKLKGCRAFLKVVDSNLARALTANIASFEDEEEESATGIIGVIVDEEGGMDVVMKNDKIYDLSGRAISSESMVKGNIYIHNGKKFIAQ